MVFLNCVMFLVIYLHRNGSFALELLANTLMSGLGRTFVLAPSEWELVYHKPNPVQS
jgi:hypothetical protein